MLSTGLLWWLITLAWSFQSSESLCCTQGIGVDSPGWEITDPKECLMRDWMKHGFWRVPEKKGHPTTGELSSARGALAGPMPCRDEEMLFPVVAPVLLAAFAGWQ